MSDTENDSPTRILNGNTINDFAEYLKSKNCKKIIILTGAGISTAAGIPDFRSPGSGLYANLQKYKLPFPEAIFDLHYFLRRPSAFYELSRELFPGKYKPTKCHRFINSLAKKGFLLRNYTQNIDMLERLAKIPHDLIVESHGSFYKASCVGYAAKKTFEAELVTSKHGSTTSSVVEEKLTVAPQSESSESEYDSEDDREEIPGCGKEYTFEEFKSLVYEKTIPTCSCKGYIKPNITFFREKLPDRFFESLQIDFSVCDALIVIGTSLNVHPFASLVDQVPSDVPRLLINREKVGTFDFDHVFSKRDALFLGNCEEGVDILANELGIDIDIDIDDVADDLQSLSLMRS